MYGVAHDRAIGVLQAVVDEPDLPRAERGELRLAFGRLLEQAGDGNACYRQFTQAVPELADRPAAQARAMATLAVLNVPDVPGGVQRRWMDRALSVLARVPDPVLETAVRGNRTVMLLAHGDPDWRDDLGRLRADPESVPHRRELARIAHGVAAYACYAGSLAEARAFLDQGWAHLGDLGYPRMELSLRSAEAVLDYHRGTWDRLHHRVDALCDDLIDFPIQRVDVEWVAGSLRLARGELSGARQHLQTAVELWSSHASIEGMALPAGALTRLHLSLGDAATAVTCATDCVSMLAARDLWAVAGPAVRWSVEALVAAGAADEAGTLTGRFEAALRGRDAPGATIAAQMCRGVLADAAGRPDEAARTYLAAAARYAAAPACPYEAAQARERAAACLLRADDDRAGPILLAALATYHELGASWDAARCARIARRYRVTLPAPYRGGRRGYGDQLSPREREVARLAANGLANKAIAAALFLSDRTVEKHLSRALHKLDVGSRWALRDLADRLT